MKKLYPLMIGLVLFYSCSQNNEDPEPAITCLPTSVLLTGNGTTKFDFNADGEVIKITVDEGTDSVVVYTYLYAGNQISTLNIIDSDGTQDSYTATYDGDKLSKFSKFFDGSTTAVVNEIRYVYNGDNMIDMQIWYAPTETSSLYQVLNYALDYDSNGNLTKSTIYIDWVAFITIAFGGEPTDPYAPSPFGSAEYSYGDVDAPNPLMGSYFIDSPDFGFMMNLPSSMTSKNESGNVIESETFTLTIDDNGYPTKAVSASGNFQLDASYNCN